MEKFVEKFMSLSAKNCDRVPDNDNGDKREKTKSDRAFFTALSVQCSPEVNDWYLDSGCSVHLAKNKHCFVSELKPAKVGFSTADQQGIMNSNSVGDIQLPVKVDGAVMPVKKGALVTNANGEVLASDTLKNNLFRLDLDSSNPIFLAAPNTGILWHSRMGHVGLSSMEKLKTLVHGIDSDMKVASDFVCKSCALENDSSDTTGDFSPVDSESADSSIVTRYEGASEDFLGFPDSAESEADDASSAVESDSDYIPPETVDVENENLRRGTRDERPPIHLQDYDLNFVLTVLSDDPVTTLSLALKKNNGGKPWTESIKRN
ncbi:hypothetical protein JTB14_013953 [Gonioctena quinquepunctata]|nr:hypothetical protein JTB14_013953 [Gonioctena quinquepunctata]